MTESLSGSIERVVFHNPENGFAVLRVKATGHRELVTVVGHAPNVVVGEYVDARGEWVNNRTHGLQFKAETLHTTPPHTLEGIERYLCSGLIKGIGPHVAKKIVETFGDRALSVIDESPTYLLEIKGIGPKRVQLIRESWQQQRAVRDIMMFLHQHGVGTARAMRIHKTYGDQAIDMVRSNPYRLANDIWGIGFQTADELAGKLGIARDSPLRAQAAVRYMLQRMSAEGHCGYPETRLIEGTAEMTGISPEVIAAAVEYERSQGELVRETKVLPKGEEAWIYLKPLFLAELGVARGLCQLRQGKHPLPSLDMEKALNWVERRIGLRLAASQRQAIAQAATQKVLVITGGPGVGKTTIVRAIVDIFAAKELHVELCAPTGRAAKRLSETTGREARTIHRLLEFDPVLGGFKKDRHDPLEVDLLIVDEVSMVDVVLMNQLLKAVPAEACLVLVGDVDQLPSVGPGTVLTDIIDSGMVPTVRLTEIFRQAGESWIVRAAHQVNQGERPESAPAHQGDFFFLSVNDPAVITERVITMVRERIPARFHFDPFRDIQVLTPMNRSELGVRNLNSLLQNVLNPARPGAIEIQRFGWTFRVGDKVLQTVNNYQKDVFNGDIGRVVDINKDDQEMLVNFDGREIPYDFNELDELALAYALTVHKAQGSEYPAVVIPLHTQHYLLLQRNLLYTGITRGKKLVVVVGSPRALQLAVQRQDTNRRYTALRERLRQLDKSPPAETEVD
ncbi:MAG: ATP-dependent RecD-like DNA helicase [Gemmataceae bacterium]